MVLKVFSPVLNSLSPMRACPGEKAYIGHKNLFQSPKIGTNINLAQKYNHPKNRDEQPLTRRDVVNALLGTSAGGRPEDRLGQELRFQVRIGS